MSLSSSDAIANAWRKYLLRDVPLTKVQVSLASGAMSFDFPRKYEGNFLNDISAIKQSSEK